jgi:four helix bundle protein
MVIEKFEEIIAWKKAEILTIEIYNFLKNNKDYSFKDQIQRASVSIMNNIAEGFERRSNKEFKQFLFIAKGSAGETRSMLHLAKQLGYISEIEYLKFCSLTIEIAKLLSGLIKTL